MKIVLTITTLLLFAGVHAQNDSIYAESSVQIRPIFPGGPSVWTFFLKKYKLQPVDDSTTNTAVIMLVVNKNGTVPDARVMNSDYIDVTLTRRLKKALSAMPHWVPALLDEKRVSCRTTFLIQLAD